MATIVKMAQTDTRPPIQATLTDEDGEAINLTSCTIVFHLMKNGSNVISKTATIVDAATGIVKHTWTDESTDTLLGEYQAEFTVTFSDGKKQSFPSDGSFTIQFRKTFGA